MTPQESFITRLRRHRERNRVSLDEIATQTRIKREQLEAFEQGDLENWPRGLYARAWVRAYANVVGLDPIDTVDEFCKLFPHGDRRAQPTFREYAAIIAHQSTYQDEFEHLAETDRRASDGSPAPAPSWRRQMHRLVRSLLSLRPARTPRAVRSVRTN
jgi:transcriptional regulator with XRE-family HTH domain